jgi:hypothetical protein
MKCKRFEIPLIDGSNTKSMGVERLGVMSGVESHHVVRNAMHIGRRYPHEQVAIRNRFVEREATVGV